MAQFIEFLGNHVYMTAAWAILFVLLVSSYVTGALSKVKTVNTHEMTMLVNRENGVVVDIRKPAEFNKGHITDSVNLPMEKISNAQFGSLEKNKTNPIIVVCNAGISAKTAANTLVKAGYENVAVLQGGMQTWTSANLPVIKSK
ncbi:rhodanese-like domain-containing protein [Psychrosphaera aestuarii]|uniref:rhodanese-like domain-containing protein n=1 Tax=Psychrosphaera aestuarii TaxID=1266052 RepID=UPI001B31967C|nr:rhodanese-like domain-containing protein [Psychrosphaera aestuarii]